MTYYDNNVAYISNNFNLDARFYTLAMNLIREGVIAVGRGEYPFTDNDGAIMHNVFLQLKNLSGESGVNRQQEHQSLSASKDAPHPAQESIANVLKNIDLLEGAAGGLSEASPVKASLPKTAQQKS